MWQQRPTCFDWVGVTGKQNVICTGTHSGDATQRHTRVCAPVLFSREYYLIIGKQEAFNHLKHSKFTSESDVPFRRDWHGIYVYHWMVSGYILRFSIMLDSEMKYRAKYSWIVRSNVLWQNFGTKSLAPEVLCRCLLCWVSI